jgi:segregation and condensation protein B
MKRILEALIFASEQPLSFAKMCQILDDVDSNILELHLRELLAEYRERDGGFQLFEVAGGFQFRTTSDTTPWIKKLKGIKFSLSSATLETLAVIAYRQPVVKAEIDTIRGVDTGSSIRKLLDNKLVRIVGRKDVPGRPIIYGTTKKFLEIFSLKDLSDLPTLQEIADLEHV